VLSTKEREREIQREKRRVRKVRDGDRGGGWGRAAMEKGEVVEGEAAAVQREERWFEDEVQPCAVGG
jgi:hypothetical protein